MTVPLGPNCRLEPTPDLRTVDGGKILIGGAPFRVLRLTSGGAGLVKRWFAGEPIADRTAHHDLARRLETSGMANLRWPTDEAAPLRPTVAVVIPSHDDLPELERTLAAAPQRFGAEVLVVDDGSTPAIESPSPDVTVIRRPLAGGPGPARQAGLDATTADIVIFIDAGVTLDHADATGLVAAFDDPAVVAAAPRVRSEPARHLAARYDVGRSPLDLGPRESLVGPGRSIPYVPTACLAVRAEAVRAVGGFDPGLRYGEDVDLVWRLGRIGNVRYLPSLTAIHRPRPSLLAMLAQRRTYGSSAAPLATRHGAATLTPCRVSPWSALVLALTLGRRPFLAVSTAVGTGLALRPKLEPMPDARAEAINLTLRGHWYGSLSILTAALRAWFPLLLPLLARGGRARRLAGTIVAAGVARRAIDGPRDPAGAMIDLSIGLADDLAYCAGLWEGVIASRSVDALRPELSSWPGGGPSMTERLGRLRARLRPGSDGDR